MVSVACGGCYNPSPAVGVPCPTNVCPQGQTCAGGFCTDGDALPVDASCATTCTEDVQLDCNNVAVKCVLGCSKSDPDRCARMVPSNGIDPALLAGTTAAVTGALVVFDTVTGTIRDGATIIRKAGTGTIDGIAFEMVGKLAVFAAPSFAVPANAMWTAVGDVPIALFGETIDVAGAIDVGGLLAVPGVGGGIGGTDAIVHIPPGGCGAGQDGGANQSGNTFRGGGGGGGATEGGESESGGDGGKVCEQPSTRPLAGGNGGGAGAVEGTMQFGGNGGGGGGAIALVAMRSLTISGAVGAPGAGGGSKLDNQMAGGGGGGGGGAVLVESPSVALAGALTANGGGGGGARNAKPGDRGHLVDGSPALGGQDLGLEGGNGGAGAMPPTDGEVGRLAALRRRRRRGRSDRGSRRRRHGERRHQPGAADDPLRVRLADVDHERRRVRRICVVREHIELEVHARRAVRTAVSWLGFLLVEHRRRAQRDRQRGDGEGEAAPAVDGFGLLHVGQLYISRAHSPHV
jgi:hypothetical protein